MKKIITFLAVIIISLFCLCACGTESGETTTDAVHIHAYGEWQTVKEAGCVNAGRRERTCDCGDTETEEIPALGHIGGTAENCKSRAKCERCGKEYGDYGPHIGGEATCKQRARCEVCSYPYGEVDPDNHKKILAATCVSKEKCRDCKKELGDSLDPKNHKKLEGKGLDKVCAGCKRTLLPETDAGIVDSTNEKPIDFNEYLSKVTRERDARLSKPFSGKDYTHKPTDERKMLSAAERASYIYDAYNMPKRSSSEITKEQAIDDVKFAFKAIYTYYGLYEYFGGDEVFEAAEKEAIQKINERFEQKQSFMSDTEFLEILRSSLDFIVDSHGGIYTGKSGGSFTNLNKKKYYSYCFKDVIFREDDIGYYALVKGKKWYLESINDGDFSEYLKVTIDESGELVYTLVRIANPYAESLEGDTVTLKRGDTVCRLDIDWTMLGKFSGGSGETIWGTRVENGVPIIHSRTVSNIYSAELDKFVASGSQFSDQKLFIFDLRGNSGGNSLYVSRWLKNYFPCAWFSYPCSISGVMSPWKTQQDQNMKIVLIDKGVCSSGEMACNYLSAFTNTLMVGTNTSGCVLAGNYIYAKLPKSGIILGLGTFCWDYPNDYYKGMNPEGIGFMPDVFVDGKDALDLSMKMIEYYGIKKSKDTSSVKTYGTGKR